MTVDCVADGVRARRLTRATEAARRGASDAAGGGYQTVFAEVPLREVTTYARTLSSMTGGQGSFSMEFAHYDVMPGNVQQEIIAQHKKEKADRERPEAR